MRRKATWGLLGLLALGSLWGYYMGDQTGRVAENATAFTIDTRDPDSVVFARSLAQGEETSATFTIDTRDADSVVLAKSLAQGEESSTSFVIDTRDPDAVVFALSLAQVEDSLGLIIDTRDPLPLDSDNDGVHDFWEQMYFGSIFAHDLASDPDGDGLSNFAEFAFGTNPTEHDDLANGPSSINVAIRLDQVGGVWIVTLSYPRHVLAGNSVTYTYETASSIAGPWTNTTSSWVEVGNPVTLNGYVERVAVSMPLPSKPNQLFARVHASRK